MICTIAMFGRKRRSRCDSPCFGIDQARRTGLEDTQLQGFQGWMRVSNGYRVNSFATALRPGAAFERSWRGRKTAIPSCMSIANPTRSRRPVESVLWIEGAANLSAVLAKLVVGLVTGSIAILSDAAHSLADLANNAVGIAAARISATPPDREHPYGHRKFETLAVFGTATLLCVLALELAHGAVAREDRVVAQQGWSLAVMLGVLIVNVALCAWEGDWARQLDSDILRADSRHTLSDVLTTVGVTASWQLAANGQLQVDVLCALVVAGLILYPPSLVAALTFSWFRWTSRISSQCGLRCGS